MPHTESSIQSLKAQEAKDLAIELLQKLNAKARGPISPGELQLHELEYELKLREAESEDQRCRERHERQIKELELQIAQEKARVAEAATRADEVRAGYATVIERVSQGGESLSTQLERATREHNLKVEQLTATFAAKQAELSRETEELEMRRDALRAEISTLTDLRGEALEVGRLADEIARRKKETEHEHADLEELAAAAEFEKTKRIRAVEREQELALAKLDAEHQRQVIERNRKAADAVLQTLGMVAVEKQQWEELQQRPKQVQQLSEAELEACRDEARAELRREYNITRAEPLDVTDLYYREQSARGEAERLRGELEKIDSEVRRMRQHIEHEPQRIAAAVEAAKTSVQNYIEQSPKR